MNKNRSETFFSEEEKHKIEEAVKAVEQHTAGEVAVMVVSESDDYREAEVTGAIIASMFFSFVLFYFTPELIWLLAPLFTDSVTAFVESLLVRPFGLQDELRYLLLYGIWYFVPATCILFFPLRWLLSKVGMYKSFFISKNIKQKKVGQRALQSFYEQGLYKTRDETGVLFYISLFERTVYLLADKGIYEKISQQKLDEYARIVSRGIKAKKACDAVCEAIQKVGVILSEHFPIKPDDTNELPDSVITG